MQSHFFVVRTAAFQTLKISVPGFKQFVPVKRNAFGVTVGNMTGSAGHSHGFVNSGGKTVAITVPGAIDTFVTGINRYGSIVGNFTSTANPSGAFELKNGKFSFIQVAKGNKVASISDTGVIVGTYLVGTGNQQHVHGFVLANGKFRDFMFPGSTDTHITDINAGGMIVGNFDVISASQVLEVNNFIFKNGRFFRAPIPVTEFIDNTTGLGLIKGVNGFGEVTGTAFFDPEPTLSLSLAFVAKCSF